MATNILDIDMRKKIINEVRSEENIRRKADSFKRLDIYKKNQRKYILERIQKDLSPETLANMRTFTSINFTQKIINAKASVYKNAPTREFSNATDREKEQIDAIYKYAKADVKLKKANRIYKLEDQAAVQVLPKDGCLHLRVLAPHHFDVVPMSDMPEKAEIYILSGFDKWVSYQNTQSAQMLDPDARGDRTLTGGYRDRIDETIADQDDYLSQLNYFVFWSKDFNFACNKAGEILDKNNQPYGTTIPMKEILNPVAPLLPFIDLVTERDFEYWAQTGSNVTDLQLDIGAQISDTCDVNFRQGYSQAILSATEAPKSMQIGPHTLLFLKKDPRVEAAGQPEFEFATPSPDLASSIRLTEMLLAMGLTSEGLDSNIISTGSRFDVSKTYSSGYERLLAQIEEFSASQDDFQLFEGAEEDLFEILKAWSNALQDVNGDLALRPELKNGVIGESVELNITFETPQMVQNQTDKEASDILKMESGLMSRKMAVMDIYNVDEDKAQEIIDEIDAEAPAPTLTGVNDANGVLVPGAAVNPNKPIVGAGATGAKSTAVGSPNDTTYAQPPSTMTNATNAKGANGKGMGA